MIVRFARRPDPAGWTIYDRLTGEPAVVEGMVPMGLPLADANDLVDLLNTLHMLKLEPTCHEAASTGAGTITRPRLRSPARLPEARRRAR